MTCNEARVYTYQYTIDYTVSHETFMQCKISRFSQIGRYAQKGMTSLLSKCMHVWGRHGLAAAVSRVATKQSVKRESYARLTCDILSPSLQQLNGKTVTLLVHWRCNHIQIERGQRCWPCVNIRTTKISAGGFMGKSAKICTCKICIPLYSMHDGVYHCHHPVLSLCCTV